MATRATNKLQHKQLLADIAKLRAAKATGSFGDGGGLTLVVTAAGNARWTHKYQWQGRTAERMFVGQFPDGLSLAQAREMRDSDRKLLRDGLNPIVAAKAAVVAAQGVPTFSAYAKDHASFLAPGHASARLIWLRQMTGDDTKGVTVGPLATMPIDSITLADVKAVIAPLWFAKPTTAKELLGRVRRVLDHRYVNTGQDERANPADFRRIERAIGKRYAHHPQGRAALPYEQAPAFMARLAERPQLSARALEMVVLSGCRVGEVLGARWGEIDLRARTFTVPPSRMKTQDNVHGEPHVVPLSLAMVKVLRRALPPVGRPEPGALIFPNARGKAFDDKTLLLITKVCAIGYPAATSHGFRSSLVGWGTAIPHRKHGPFDHDLMQVTIAHVIGTRVDQVYLRDRWLDRRRVVMREWSRFCSTAPGANVVAFRRAA